MKRPWRLMLVRQLALVVLAGVILGALTQAYAWSLVATLTLYLVLTLRQVTRLLDWLHTAQLSDSRPHDGPLWDMVFHRIHSLFVRHQRTLERLKVLVKRIQTSTAALSDGVIMLDSEGNLDWWNPAAEHLLGLRHPHDQGQPITNLVRSPLFKEYFESRHYHEPLELPSPSNERLRLQVVITPYGSDERLILVRDMTHMHQLEQVRKDFVANVSHELRTPLTVITGYLETMSDHAEDIHTRWKRPLQQMQAQALRMQNLLTDLLLLAQLEATDQPVDDQPFLLRPLLTSILHDAQALSGSQKHEIELQLPDPELKLCGSESELRSAFSNLVFNAVKYTPAQGHIEIRAWSDTQGIYVQVRDTGLGIAAHHLPRLTERFYRVDASRSSRTGGTGLGLSIVKHVLLRHQGYLDISSTLGRGSSFTCHFPNSVAMTEEALAKHSGTPHP